MLISPSASHIREEQRVVARVQPPGRSDNDGHEEDEGAGNSSRAALSMKVRIRSIRAAARFVCRATRSTNCGWMPSRRRRW